MTPAARLEYMKMRFPQMEKDKNTPIEVGLPAMIPPTKSDIADELKLLSDTVIEHKKDIQTNSIALTSDQL
jgi:hypothetical protein